MRKILAVATLFLGALSVQAQEKVMKIQKSDGTIAQTRVADLKQISFLSVEEGIKGLLIKSLDGREAAVLFEANPKVTIASGKLTMKSNSAADIVFEVEDIAEISFDEEAIATSIGDMKDFDCMFQNDGTLLRNIPQGVTPSVYAVDGRKLPTPPMKDGELQLNRSTLGSGVFIVKIGSFTTKIKL